MYLPVPTAQFRPLCYRDGVLPPATAKHGTNETTSSLTERILVRLGSLAYFGLHWSLVPMATLPIGSLAAPGLVGSEHAWEQSVRSRYGEVLLWAYVVIGQSSFSH